MADLPDIVRYADRRDRRLSSPVDQPDLAADLLRAIDRGDIAVHFQPQVRIADDRVTGVEALARWDHPLLGRIDADQLFAAADRAGLASNLSEHIQRLALSGAAGWPSSLGALDLSLNVTAGDIADERFAAALLERVARSGLAPRRLCVEVTESAPIADLAAAAAALQELRDAGVRVAIDDFGSGYAGFAWIKALPFDRLKIDKSLVADVVESKRARAVVRGIVAMADALSLDVIAEGVETGAQRDAVAAEGCGWFQGFLRAGALDTAALAALMGTHG